MSQMARTKKLTYGAVNITMHPHSPEKYVELFRMARKNSENINLRGDSYATLSFFILIKKDSQQMNLSRVRVKIYRH